MEVVMKSFSTTDWARNNQKSSEALVNGEKWNCILQKLEMLKYLFDWDLCVCSHLCRCYSSLDHLDSVSIQMQRKF